MDWTTVSEKMNRFARIDTSLARRLNDLSEHQARENKLAFAIESGRIYGLRAQKCNMLLKGNSIQSGVVHQLRSHGRFSGRIFADMLPLFSLPSPSHPEHSWSDENPSLEIKTWKRGLA